jgi:hypothetical protein
MSEYQYYEFRAIDRTLGQKELLALRRLSTRARITPTRFINEYEFGDFRGKPEALMETYFDAHLYLANWGSRRLMLRLPCRLLDEKTAAKYCVGRRATARSQGAFVILDFKAEVEGYDEWDEGVGWLASLVRIRTQLLGGDLRALYLGWLMCAQHDDLDQAQVEPPVPAGLGRLPPPLDRFARFLDIDPALIEVAAEGQPAGGAKARRKLGELLASARVRAEENNRSATEQEAKERARAEAKLARDRNRRLNAVARDELGAWREVDAYLAPGRREDYDQAVSLLVDLRDLAARDGKLDGFVTRLRALRAQYQTRSGLLKRISDAGVRSTAGGKSWS